MQNTPSVAVFNGKYAKGVDLNTPPETLGAENYARTELLVSLFECRDYDAYSVCYRPKGISAGEYAYRVNKPALRPGGPFYGQPFEAQALQIDFDLVDHGSWTSQSQIDAYRDFLCQTDLGPLGQWAAWATSEHGWHLWYALDTPVGLEDLESLTRGVIQAFTDLGIPIDHRASDWTRLLGLPRITKPDGMRTWEQPWYSELWCDREVAVADLPRVASSKIDRAVAASTNARAEALDALEAVALIHDPDDFSAVTPIGRKLRTVIASALNSVGEHSEFFRSVLTGAPLAQGGRDDAVARSTGALVSRLIGLRELPECSKLSADHLVGLVAPCLWATDLEGLQESGQSWLDKAQDKIHEFWARDHAEHVRKAELARQDAEWRAAEASRAVQAAASGLSPAQTPETPSESPTPPQESTGAFLAPHEREAVLRGDLSVLGPRALLKLGSSRYLRLMEDLTYSTASASFETLVGSLLRSNLAEPLGMIKTQADGTRKEVSANRVRTMFLSTAEIADCDYRSSERAHYEAVGYDAASGVVQVADRTLCVHRIEPVHSPLIEAWFLKMAGGGAAHSKLLAYMAAFPRFEDLRVPALVLTGAPSTGKTPILRALSRFAPTRPFRTLRGRFLGETLQNSLILKNDDGVLLSATAYTQIRDQAEVLKNLCSGQDQESERKYESSVTVRLPYRILIAQNSDEIQASLETAFSSSRHVDQLTGVYKRLFCLHVDKAMAEWIPVVLQESGHLDEHGRAQDESRLIDEIASHIAWISSTHDPYQSFSELGNICKANGQLVLTSEEEAIGYFDMGELEQSVVSVLIEEVAQAYSSGFSRDSALHLSPQGALLFKRNTLASLVSTRCSGFDRVLGQQAAKVARTFFTDRKGRFASVREVSPTTSRAVYWSESDNWKALRSLGQARWSSLDLEKLQEASEQVESPYQEAFEEAVKMVHSLETYCAETGQTLA